MTRKELLELAVTGRELADEFFAAAEGDSGDAELVAGWALAEWAGEVVALAQKGDES